jgi:hypothetical protein
MLLRILILLFLCPPALLAADAQKEDPAAASPAGAQDYKFLDNGKIKIGVKLSSGAGIAWLSGPDGRNLLNHWDRGRLIQQSYYGKKDGSMWGKTPWSWNPVQGGHYKGEGAKVLELKADEKQMYAKTLPKHWATGEDLKDVIMEEWITLEESIAHVRFKMSYTGTEQHPKHTHEIPAVFTISQLPNLVYYEGDKPWTNAEPKREQPGWPNQYHKIDENWAAFVGEDNFGLGAYVPVAKSITCYRYVVKDNADASCSYFAPLAEFPIVPSTVFEYDLYLAVGKIDEIRAAFVKLHEAADKKNAETR